MTYVAAGTAADVPPGTMTGVEVEGRKILVANASFDLATGEPLAKARLLFFKTMPRAATTYPVKVEGDRIMVGV